jgi:[FeFe] hydrogenase H-cluster maturation GTPase HydF
MTTTPKALRLHLGIFGRTNVGKSSFLNFITGQDVAIVSPMPGTTTDVVEKTMEIPPLGPVVFLDTAGIDDSSELADSRLERTLRALGKTEVALLVLEADSWGGYEERVFSEAGKRKIPVVFVVNKTDLREPSAGFLAMLKGRSSAVVTVSSAGDPERVEEADGSASSRDAVLGSLKAAILEVCPEDFLSPPPLLADLMPSGKGAGLAVLVVPIDLEAPKGRLILPQVQAIRDCLDADCAAAVVKEREYPAFLARLSSPPDLVVCDSQVVLKTVADTPVGVPCTTFSILLSRVKGDIVEAARGAAAISSLGTGDRVLVAEACSHHALEDDIGRVKLPRWIRQFAGADVAVDVSQGKDFPADLGRYRLAVHCGACALTRREMLGRAALAREAGVPMTNYGMAISALQGVIRRTLDPFPAALDAYDRELERLKVPTAVGKGA